MTRVNESDVFEPRWPDGLEPDKRYEVLCDDNGVRCDAKLSVVVDSQGDVYLCMREYRDENRDHTNLKTNPHVRICTRSGGGRMHRTRQALLWLAKAIELDTADNPWRASDGS